MSYTGSKAQSGFGSKLEINTGTTSSPTWVLVDECVGLTQTGTANKTDDVTNLSSTAEEFIATILSPGSWDFMMNRLTASAGVGQAAVLTSFNAATIKQYKVTLPINIPCGQTTAGDFFVFLALVEKFPISEVKVDKKVAYTATLKISGAIVFTPGS